MKTSFVLLLVFAAGCSSDRESHQDSAIVTVAPVAPASPARASPAQPLRPGCEHTGKWSECTLERRLKQQGFVVKRLDEKVSRPGFDQVPVVYMLGASRLEAFFYESDAEVAGLMLKLDTVAAAPKGVPGAWPSTPVFIRSANLAAVFLGQNPRQVERLTLAITAGPPQPGSPR